MRAGIIQILAEIAIPCGLMWLTVKLYGRNERAIDELELGDWPHLSAAALKSFAGREAQERSDRHAQGMSLTHSEAVDIP